LIQKKILGNLALKALGDRVSAAASSSLVAKTARSFQKLSLKN
jgi:hypothetical protein